MFNDKDKIKDDRDYFSNPNKGSLMPVGAILGVLFVASTLMKDANLYDFKNFIKDTFGAQSGDENAVIFQPKHKNEMFCPAEYQMSDLKDYFDDPFKDFRYADMNDFKFFWTPSDKPKTLSFKFGMEAKQTHDKEDWFKTIPDYVIDDPSIQFILSGHASYDLDEKYGRGNGVTQMPDNFDAILERHREVNKRYVDDRLESIKQKLIEMGISEDRIITRNYGHRFDRRAVDIEVCLPDQIPPEVPQEHNM